MTYIPIMPQKYNRRKWNSLVLTGLAGSFIPSVFASCSTTSVVPAALKGSPAASDAKDLGIVLGIQTYSFRDRSLEETIKAMQQLGVKSCELWEGHVEPRNLQWAPGQTAAEAKKKQEQLTQWRQKLSMEEIRGIKLKFDQAGITIQAYNGGIKDASRTKALTSCSESLKHLVWILLRALPR